MVLIVLGLLTVFFLQFQVLSFTESYCRDSDFITSLPDLNPLRTVILQLCRMKQKHTKYTQINTNKSTHNEMVPV